MIPIIKHRKIWFVFSGALVALSLIFISVWQLKFGIDFTGGSLLEVEWQGSAPEATVVREKIASDLTREIVVQSSGENKTLIRMENLSEDRHQKILSDLKTSFGDLTELRFDSVGPVVGAELFSKAIWALILTFLAIIIYIAISFRKVSKPVASWKYGIITVLTGFHDCVIPLGLFAVLGKFYNIEVDAAFVAAVLTILGYSINDTIVVLDRVRENVGRSTVNFEETVEMSVNQTVARSINTSITTLLALLAVFFFGGPTTKSFALALIVGIATGTYSSIFIASPLLVVWHKKICARL